MREVCEKRERECAKNLKKKKQKETEKEAEGTGRKLRATAPTRSHVQRQRKMRDGMQGKCDEPRKGKGMRKKRSGNSGRKKVVSALKKSQTCAERAGRRRREETKSERMREWIGETGELRER
jgi:hypothetical protein